MVKFNFIYKKKKFSLNVEVCDNFFSKASGLMFRKKSKPLLFVFKRKTREAIHSLFCVPFVCVWFDRNKIIDIKYVKPWKLSVKPLSKFDKFLEIPVNDKNFDKIKKEFDF